MPFAKTMFCATQTNPADTERRWRSFCLVDTSSHIPIISSSVPIPPIFSDVRDEEGTMKRCVAGLAAVAVLALTTGNLRAWGGKCCSRGCTWGCAAPADYCRVTYQYQTEYRKEQRTVHRWVPETTMHEIRETVLVPSWRQEQRQYTVLVAKYHEEKRQRTRYETEWKTENRTRTVLVPQTTQVEQKYTVCLTDWHTENRQMVVSIPETHLETRQHTYMVCRQVPKVVTRRVVCYQPVGCCGECAQVVRDVPCTVYESVPETRVATYQVPVCTYRQETRNYTVQVPTTRQEVRSRMVPVVQCVARTENYTVQVPVPKPVVENYTVQVCNMVPETRTTTVSVPECKTEVRTRKVPVTTCRLVSEVITVTVPVIRCIAVPCAAPVVCASH
jgi:hypothetical protein